MRLADALRDRGDRRPWTTGAVLSIDAATERMLVEVDGGRASLPFAPGQYSVGDTVAIVRDPYRTGAGQFVVARIGAYPGRVVRPAVSANPGLEPPAVMVTAEAVILPIWTGTYRAAFGGWGLWNDQVDDLGGAAALYQGQQGESGPLVGVAVYGTQVADLGATTIESMTVDVDRTTGSGTPVLQGSALRAAPTGAPPAPAGPQVLGLGRVDLGVTVDRWRTGLTTALHLVGTAYAGVHGTDAGNGMALRIRYTKRGV